jgi:hypothetical protein
MKYSRIDILFLLVTVAGEKYQPKYPIGVRHELREKKSSRWLREMITAIPITSINKSKRSVESKGFGLGFNVCTALMHLE